MSNCVRHDGIPPIMVHAKSLRSQHVDDSRAIDMNEGLNAPPDARHPTQRSHHHEARAWQQGAIAVKIHDDRAIHPHAGPGNITEFSSVEAMKQCVCVGMGLALLPSIVVTRELRQHRFKALHWAGPSLDIATHILWHKDKWVSPAMAAFLELLQTHLEEDELPERHLAIAGSFR